MKNYTLSFQLYSSRLEPSIDAQLESLAGIGFLAIESYGGAYGDDVAGFRQKLDRVGLACPTAHIPLNRLEEDLGGAIAEAEMLGAATIIAPNLLAQRRPTTAAGWREVARGLDRHAATLRQRGLKLAWHNHDFEYMTLQDGSRPIDHLMMAPDLLFQADIGMMARAGVRPEVELKRFGDRLHSVHVKDLAAKGDWTDVGAGTLDWPAIWPTIGESAAEILVLEHDDPGDWRQFARNSFEYVFQKAM